MWRSRGRHMTGFKGDSQRLREMSILAKYRSALRTFGAIPASGDSACGLHAAIASVCARQQLWTCHHRLVTRRLSSESKDELRVRYLDGQDSGERRP